MRLLGLYATAVIGILTVALLPELAPAQTATPSNSPIGVFLGHWEGSGTFFDTKMSKAGTVKAKCDCEWSPQHRDMICEQAITDSTGTHEQLTVFAPTEKQDEVRYATLNGGSAPTSGVALIRDGAWIFSGENTSEGVTTMFRTTNTFQPDKEIYKVEYSQDHGAHWTKMLDGEQHRVR